MASSPRRTAFLVALVAAVLAAGISTLLLIRSTPRVAPQPLAPFTLPRLGGTGDPVDIRTVGKSAAGQPRGLVINFFFSTCPPCAEELPVLEAASQMLPDTVSMVGIVHSEAEKTAVPFVREFGLTYDVLLDEQGFVAPNLGVLTFPTTLFVDSSGMVVKRHLGAISAKELQQGINQIAHAS